MIRKTYKGNWYEFTPGFSNFALTYSLAGYYSHHPILHISIIWGNFFITLPWTHYKMQKIEKNLSQLRKDKLQTLKNPNFKPKDIYVKQYYDEVDPPSYGIYYYMDQIGIKYGKNTKLFNMPWALDWIRTSALKKDHTWIHETKKNRDLEFYDKNKWKDILFNETYPYIYTDKYNNTENCLATITVREREWRPKCLKWCKLFNKIIKDIDIEFNSIDNTKFTGKVVGYCYKMLPNETPYQTLKRMEKEKKF